jgi:drug/metabolite transporter (DMT)-like permease
LGSVRIDTLAERHRAADAQDKPRLARPAVYIAVLSVSFSAILVRLTDAGGMAVAFYRMFFSSLLVIPLYLLKRPRLPDLKSSELRMCVLSGVFLGLHFATWITSLKYTSVASSVTLVTTQPLFVAVLSSLFLGEKPGRSAIVGMALAVAGSAALVYQGMAAGSMHLTGDLLALAGAAFASAYLILGRVLRRSLKVESYALVTYVTSAVTIGLVCAAVSPEALIVSSRDMAITFAMALVCTMIGHTLLNWALEFVSASFVAVMILGEPVGSSLWAALLFREIPSGLQAAACCALLAGIFVFVRGEAARSGRAR